MPCLSDGRPSRADVEYPKLRATLCAILRHWEDQGMNVGLLLEPMDWEDAGVTKMWVLGWWAEHQAEDERRRQLEADTARRRAARASALAKLTPEERAALLGKAL